VLPGLTHSHPVTALIAKSNIEMDRLMWAREEGGYEAVITRLLRPELLPTKADLLIGAPTERLLLRRADLGVAVTNTPSERQPIFNWPWI